MRRTLLIVIALGLTTFAFAAAPSAAADDVGDAFCTLSYPATCQVDAGDAKLVCSGVGTVPDCRAS